MLVEETTVPAVALPLPDFRAHLRLGTGFSGAEDVDSQLEASLRAAMAAIEARTGRILIERRFAWSAPDWTDPCGQVLPVAPVSALAEVALIDREGTATVLPPDTYRLSPDDQSPRLLSVGATLPHPERLGQVRVRFDAGYGPDWADLPTDLAHATFLLAAQYYDYRHEQRSSAMPYTVEALIARYRPVRLGGIGR